MWSASCSSRRESRGILESPNGAVLIVAQVKLCQINGLQSAQRHRGNNVRVFVLNRVVDHDFRRASIIAPDIGDFAASFWMFAQYTGHPVREHSHAAADTRPAIYTGALENPFLEDELCDAVHCFGSDKTS